MSRKPPPALIPTPGCGFNDWWCHGSCRRHGRCMYVQHAPSPDKVQRDALDQLAAASAPMRRTLDDIHTARPAALAPLNPDRAQLSALADDAPARAHAARLERERRDRESRAADHWAD